jgi:ankyrin repeat protein
MNFLKFRFFAIGLILLNTSSAVIEMQESKNAVAVEQKNKSVDSKQLKEYTREFFKAIKNGDVSMIEQSAKLVGDVNVRDRYDDTGLIVASRLGKLNIVKRLVNMGADIGLQGENGLTAIHFAARHANYAVLDFLCSCLDKMDEAAATQILNARSDDHGRTALHLAADFVVLIPSARHKGESLSARQRRLLDKQHEFALAIAKRLIKSGADVFALDKYGHTPLFYAVCNNDITLAKYLLAKMIQKRGRARASDLIEALDMAELFNKRDQAFEEMLEFLNNAINAC